MRCLDARRLYERGFTDPLTLEEELQVEAHLEQCTRCAEALEHPRRFDSLLRGLPGAPVERLDPEASRAAIWDRIDALEGSPDGPGEAERRVPQGFRRKAWTSNARIAGLASVGLAAAALWALALGPWNVLETTGSEGRSIPDPSEGVASGRPTPSTHEGPESPESPRSIGPVGLKSPVDLTISAVHAPGPVAALERSDLDRARLDQARSLVRSLLAGGGGAPDAAAPREAWEEEAERIGRAVEEQLGSWPVVRLVEGLVLDADAQLARRALRVLGVRGDGNSARVLERALHDADLAPAAIEGLCDLGPLGEEGLGRALWSTPFGGRVLEQMEARVAAGGVEAERTAAWIRRSIEAHVGPVQGSDPTSGPARGLLSLLNTVCDARQVDSEAPGPFDGSRLAEHRRWLFELAADPRWRPAALEALAPLEGVEDELLVRLYGRVPRTDEGLLLDLVERLRSAEALAWVEEVCRRDERVDRRVRALEVLAGLGGREGVERLVSLRREFARGPFERAFGRALALHGESFAEYGAFLAGRGARAEAREFLDLLLGLADPRAVPVLCVLSRGRALADDDRERALLIAGELGAGSAAAQGYLKSLRATFDDLDADERDLAAACLWSARRMGALGDEASAHSWLPESTDAGRRRVVELLAGEEPAQSATLRRFQLARELDSVLIHRGESERFARDSKRRSRRFLGGLTP